MFDLAVFMYRTKFMHATKEKFTFRKRLMKIIYDRTFQRKTYERRYAEEMLKRFFLPELPHE